MASAAEPAGRRSGRSRAALLRRVFSLEVLVSDRYDGPRRDPGNGDGAIRGRQLLAAPDRLLSELARLLAVMRQVNQPLAYSTSGSRWEMIARARRGKPIAVDQLRRQVQQRTARGKLSGPRAHARRRRVT